MRVRRNKGRERKYIGGAARTEPAAQKIGAPKIKNAHELWAQLSIKPERYIRVGLTGEVKRTGSRALIK